MKLYVAALCDASPDVRVITFRHTRRAELPKATPGAHVDLRLPDGRVRQYSLCGDPAERSCYRIAVKREDEGRGGSRWVHENLHPGAEAHVSAPRNNFPLQPAAERHVLVAGGIGITPMVAMAHGLAATAADFKLHYCAHHACPPFLDELERLCGDRLFLHVTGGGGAGRFDACSVFEDAVPGTHIYCCGPPGLNEAVAQATRHWLGEQVHFEAFQTTDEDGFEAEPFEVRIASTGQAIHVPAGCSALQTLRENGFALPSSCENGLCGSCECGYLDGDVIHRDSILSPDDRRRLMTPCVSRAKGCVTLDL